MNIESESRLLTPHEAAQRLGTTPGTLSVWRSTKRYQLPYVRMGRAIRYREQDIEAFIESRTVRPASVED